MKCTISTAVIPSNLPLGSERSFFTSSINFLSLSVMEWFKSTELFKDFVVIA